MHLACVLATALTLFSLRLPPSPQEPASSSDSSTPAPAATENVQTQPAAQPEPPKIGTPKKGFARVRTRKRHAPKPATTDGEPRKIVVPQGGASEPAMQIVPGVSEEEARRQRQNAQELLSATESNLKKLGARTLNPNQQETIGQIRHYMEGARSALKEGDTQRAHTLAQKSYLLSDDLAKR
jgi:hypothetical protein